MVFHGSQEQFADVGHERRVPRWVEVDNLALLFASGLGVSFRFFM